jgi:hypothetical protein
MSIRKEDCRIERLPSKDSMISGWDIVRAKPEQNLPLVIVSTDVFGIRTHYWNRRTGPCLKSGCDACAAKMLSRWNGYLLAIVEGSNQHVIFEFTPAAAMAFDVAFKEYETLRGLRVIAKRVGKATNSKVHVAVKGKHPNAHKLPAEPEIWPILSHIWGLHESAAAVPSPLYFDGLAEVETADIRAAAKSAARKVRARGPAPDPQKGLNGNHGTKSSRNGDVLDQLLFPVVSGDDPGTSTP